MEDNINFNRGQAYLCSKATFTMLPNLVIKLTSDYSVLKYFFSTKITDNDLNKRSF